MVIRVGKNNELNNARPCYRCTLMLKALGINKVYYSINNNIICEKVSQMISINSSNTWKKVDRIIHNAPNNIFDYYKYIINKMPKTIKKINAEHFVRYIHIEVEGCNYKFIKNKLIIYINNDILGEIYII
jgi:hypothetical protein